MTGELWCNDIHSKLNRTRVAEIFRPVNEKEVIDILKNAALENRPVSICGARHAMGGQQFGEDTSLIDLCEMCEIGPVDHEHGWIEIAAGVKWPELIAELHRQQTGREEMWTIRQKQTGADDLTLGGSLAANIHGRGLNMRPVIDDVEAFTLIDADGNARRCSRDENRSLFGLAIGGYGCFGVITSVCLRLVERVKLERQVKITTVEQLIPMLEKRRESGCLYGDFQFSIDETSPDFLKLGVLSSYRPVSADREMPEVRNELGAMDWAKLIRLAHHDRAKVFEVYSNFYLSTHGSLYWSDTHQLSVYLDDYHDALDRETGACVSASEMIGELYVPPELLVRFMTGAAEELRERKVTVIYGTIRLIRKDEESLLAWAKQDYACVIFNLHTPHDDQGIARSAAAFRALIDVALDMHGSFFLTYHRWARKDQIEKAYPQFSEFLREKDRLDPAHRFQSQWWRYYRDLFATGP